ncbi:MAG TPA: hypothetical protein VGB30_00920 [bacterium]|jgi:hypothetical protein
MGIRGVDIQVALQRVAEAEKLQQGETSQARTGEAGIREEDRAERLRRREQSQKPEQSDQVIVQSRREHRRRGSDRDQEAEETVTPGEENAESQETELLTEGNDGRLDILA